MKSESFRVEFLKPQSYHGFSEFDLSYWTNPHLFEDALHVHTHVHHIEEKIRQRKDFALRTEICKILRKQYSTLEKDPYIHSQIEKLQQTNCYTVICAHQPVLFGGPAYWMYKIASTISLTQRLKKQYPELEFVPVYFCGSEDHDFEEISSVRFFSKSIKWTENAGSAVGRMPLENLSHVLEELNSIFKNDPNALKFFERQHQYINENPDYKSYYRWFTHEIFGKYGLLHFDPDDIDAKKLFIPLIEKELKEEFISKHSEQACQIISQLGFTPQVNARALNLFYHHESGRKRIIRTSENQFALADHSDSWSLTEINDLLINRPENFSPNVLLRPLYQEFLFPNIAFIGGGAEIAYWLQIPDAFNAAGIPYPCLVRRLSAIHIDEKMRQRIDKANYKIEDLLMPEHALEKKYLDSIPDAKPIDDRLIATIHQNMEAIKLSFPSFDEPTKVSMEAEMTKAIKSIEHVQQKQQRFLKNKHESELNALKKIREHFFPNNSLQERVLSQLPCYFKFHQAYVDFIIECFHPEIPALVTIVEEGLDRDSA